MNGSPLGIVAGAGALPLEIALARESAGGRVFVAAIRGAASRALARGPRRVSWVRLGRWQEVIDLLRGAGVREVALAGKVPHHALFLPWRFDVRLRALLASLPDGRGHTILKGLVADLEKEGFTVARTPDLVPRLLAPEGHLAGPAPSPAQLADAAFGFAKAKALAALDVGQSVVVRGKAVVAAEAMEGTDQAIRRAGRLAGRGFTLVKVARAGHDDRFDVPTVGEGTLRTLSRGGGGALVVEAGRCLLMDRERVFALCRAKGITLLALAAEGA